MSNKVILVWFRNDLRLHDNEILFEATQKGDIVIPVYFFDPRYFTINKYEQPNTGIMRAQFLIESVHHLKQQLQEMGSDLMVYWGKPEELLTKLCAKYEVSSVYHHREIAGRETQISESVEEVLWKSQINLKHFIGHTLYHKEDLPFPIKDIPDNFSVFRKKIEKESAVRPALATIQKIRSHPHLEPTAVPTLEELGFSGAEISSLAGKKILPGGERAGLAAVEHALFGAAQQPQQAYVAVSPYIAHGCISPIYYYHAIKKAAHTASNKKKFDALISRLMWRDYFRFMLKKYPGTFFIDREELADTATKDTSPQQWATATTAYELINTLLTELYNSGMLSYEKRMVLGAFYVQEVSRDWMFAAAQFEALVLDYSPATNYGYWAHLANQGTSVKDNLKQHWSELAKKIDKD